MATRRVPAVGPEAGWAGLALYVAAYDLLAVARKKPTLSACWASHLFPSRHRAVLLVVWGGLTVHLFWPLKNLRRSLPVVVLEEAVEAAVEAVVTAAVDTDPEWELVKDDKWHWHYRRKT